MGFFSEPNLIINLLIRYSSEPATRVNQKLFLKLVSQNKDRKKEEVFQKRSSRSGRQQIEFSSVVYVKVCGVHRIKDYNANKHVSCYIGATHFLTESYISLFILPINCF